MPSPLRGGCLGLQSTLAGHDTLQDFGRVAGDLLGLGRGEGIGPHTDRFLLGNVDTKLGEHLVDHRLVSQNIVERREVGKSEIGVDLLEGSHEFVGLFGVVLLAFGVAVEDQLDAELLGVAGGGVVHDQLASQTDQERAETTFSEIGLDLLHTDLTHHHADAFHLEDDIMSRIEILDNTQLPLGGVQTAEQAVVDQEEVELAGREGLAEGSRDSTAVTSAGEEQNSSSIEIGDCRHDPVMYQLDSLSCQFLHFMLRSLVLLVSW